MSWVLVRTSQSRRLIKGAGRGWVGILHLLFWSQELSFDYRARQVCLPCLRSCGVRPCTIRWISSCVSRHVLVSLHRQNVAFWACGHLEIECTAFFCFRLLTCNVTSAGAGVVTNGADLEFIIVWCFLLLLVLLAHSVRRTWLVFVLLVLHSHLLLTECQILLLRLLQLLIIAWTRLTTDSCLFVGVSSFSVLRGCPSRDTLLLSPLYNRLSADDQWYKMAKVTEAFNCDPDFCPDCGSILPLPGLKDVVTCKLCNYQKDTSGKMTSCFLFRERNITKVHHLNSPWWSRHMCWCNLYANYIHRTRNTMFAIVASLIKVTSSTTSHWILHCYLTNEGFNNTYIYVWEINRPSF